MAEIKIDKAIFHERLGHFVSAWRADKRSGDSLFNGAASIVILMGKTEENSQFQKNNAVHVRYPKYSLDLYSLTSAQFWLLGYEFPATLMLITLEGVYIVTTTKKGERISYTPIPDLNSVADCCSQAS